MDATSTPVIPTVDNPVNITAPEFDAFSQFSLEQKVDYLFNIARRVETLIDTVTPDQIERVTKVASNPLFRKMFSGS